MDGTIEAVKKYWPWALGVVAVGWLLLRPSSSSSSADGSLGYVYDQSYLNMLQQQGAFDVQKHQATVGGNVALVEAEMAAVMSGFNALSIMNQQSTDAQVSYYQTSRQTSQDAFSAIAMQNIAAYTAGAEQTSAMANAIGQIGASTASMVGGIAQANAQSSTGFGNMLSGMVRSYAIGGW